MIWREADQKVDVTWDDVFSSAHSLRFEVSAGTSLGGSDIIQWQETLATSITFGLPATITSTSLLKVYMVVRAIAAGGNYEDVLGTIVLPG